MVRDENQRCACIGQAAIMLFVLGLTAHFQHHLNMTWGPQSYHSPIVREEQVDIAVQAARHGKRGMSAQWFRLHRPSQNSALVVHEEQVDSVFGGVLENMPLKARTPIMWIPKDALGFSDDEIARSTAEMDFVCMSNTNARIDLAGRLHVDGEPPAT